MRRALFVAAVRGLLPGGVGAQPAPISAKATLDEIAGTASLTFYDNGTPIVTYSYARTTDRVTMPSIPAPPSGIPVDNLEGIFSKVLRWGIDLRERLPATRRIGLCDYRIATTASAVTLSYTANGFTAAASCSPTTQRVTYQPIAASSLLLYDFIRYIGLSSGYLANCVEAR